MHPEVEWRSSGEFPGLEPVYHGPDEVHRWWRAVKDPFESWTIEIEHWVEVGDAVVLGVRFEAVGRESGVAVNEHFGQVFVIEDGLVRFFAAHRTWDEALAAASG